MTGVAKWLRLRREKLANLAKQQAASQARREELESERSNKQDS